jgi:hypothetical protein
MTHRLEADPHVLPCRGDPEVPYPSKGVRVLDLLAGTAIQVFEAFAAGTPGDPGTGAADAFRTWHVLSLPLRDEI